MLYSKFIKRSLDILLSLFLLPLLLLVILIISPIIYFNDKGSIFYVSKRLGKNGVLFNMIKFRTMKMNVPDIRNEDGTTFNSKTDPRLTSFGNILRTSSIDEFPQLLNVLIGQMSFVGPRPDMPDAIGLYGDKFIKKLEVRPGITGYNQAYFRNSSSLEKRFINDLFYVENINFYLDVRIIFKTVETVLSKEKVFK
jgi:lipopolysaccharide/colanic/teichoic acid biosynthesis glycosyltransferase